jgi:transcriptional regulator with XRE-family HTH domain
MGRRDERDRVARQVREMLIEARENAGLTQKALGALIGRPQSYVSNYERGVGRVDVADLLVIARALELDPKEMVGRVGPPSEGAPLA